jgi:hypothetical protein
MRFGPCHAPLEAKHLAAAATRTTTASRPLLENQMKVKHAAPAALLDPTRAHTRRSLKGRPCVRSGSRYPREVLHSETTPVASASAARSGVSIDPFASGHHARVPSSGRWGSQTACASGYAVSFLPLRLARNLQFDNRPEDRLELLQLPLDLDQ